MGTCGFLFSVGIQSLIVWSIMMLYGSGYCIWTTHGIRRSRHTYRILFIFILFLNKCNLCDRLYLLPLWIIYFNNIIISSIFRSYTYTYSSIRRSSCPINLKIRNSKRIWSEFCFFRIISELCPNFPGFSWFCDNSDWILRSE